MLREKGKGGRESAIEGNVRKENALLPALETTYTVELDAASSDEVTESGGETCTCERGW
jgi:hypothetical protein